MKKFLSKLKLIDNFIIEIEIDKTEFVHKLKEHVDEKDLGIFSDTFDAFSSSKNEYKGHVGYKNFKIKRRRRFFETSMNLAIAKGTYTQEEGILLIKTEINGFNSIMIPFYLFAIVFYSIFILTLLMTGNNDSNGAGIALPFILFHASLMLGIPYFIMRRSTKRLRHDLEREFYFMTKT